MKLGMAVIVAAVIALGTPLRAAEYEWTFQAANAAGDPAYDVMVDFADSVAALSGGRIDIRMMPVGAIVQYDQTLDAVGAGILDGHVTATVYFSGKDPAYALLGDLIAAYEHPDQMLMFIEHGGGKALLRELHARYNVFFVGASCPGKEAFVSKVPIRAVADLAGLKLRAPEGMAQDIFERAGAAPVNLPAAEVFTALERGVVDAADWSTFSMNHRLGFHGIARFPIYPGIHSMPVIEVAMNLETWNDLPPDIREIMELATRDFARDMTQSLYLMDLDDIRSARAAGVEIIDWPDSERRALRAMAVEIWDDWADRSPMARRAHDAQIAFLIRLGLLGAGADE